MKSIARFLLGFLVILLSGNLFSQDTALELDRVYGLDPLLYNGIKYTYFLPPGTGGHQYLISPDYFVGSVTIKERTFKGITLNYDIFNQQLLLRYADEKGAFNIIEVSKAWLKTFHLNSKFFGYLDLDDGPRFYQILGEGDIKMLYYWRKDLKLDVAAGSTNFTFTPAMRSSYILMNGELKPFRTKRSLIAVFEPENRPEIKKYMRKNRIKLKKAPDQVMTELISHIGNL